MNAKLDHVSRFTYSSRRSNAKVDHTSRTRRDEATRRRITRPFLLSAFCSLSSPSPPKSGSRTA
jgi:hypothetical protein